MRKGIFMAFMAVMMMTAGTGARAQETGGMKWKVEETVSQRDAEAYGIGRCFRSMEIPDDVFRRMKGRSYKSYCTVARSSLRYLRVLHYDLDGKIKVGEMVCHKDVANDLLSIFRNLFDARYPIERMRLIDDYGADDERSMAANNTSCFNFRYVAGTSVASNHSWGRAVDVNPLYNPCVKRRRNGTVDVSPKNGRRYADRSRNFSCKIDKSDLVYKEFIRHGFVWGGSWKSLKDYQHFEKKK